MKRFSPDSRLVSWLLSPYVLALIVTIPVVSLLPDFFPLYRLELTNQWLVEKPGAFIRYADINGDGNSEELLIFHNTVGKPSVKITDQNRNVLGHWYIDGTLPPSYPFLFTCDIDLSGKEKVFVFIQKQDSLFLEGMEFGRPDTFFIRDRFIALLNGIDGKFDYVLNDGLFYDMNGDGFQDFLFSVMAGYNLKPRGIFFYDVRKDRLLQHTPGGANFRITEVVGVPPFMEPVILCAGNATDNYPAGEEVPFHDSLAWLFAFDPSMKPKFPPIGFNGYTSNIYPVLYHTGSGPSIAAIFNHRGIPPLSRRLILLSMDGRIIRQKLIPVNGTNAVVRINVTGEDRDRLYIGTGNSIFRLNEMLDTVAEEKNVNSELLSGYIMDCNADGRMERVIFAPERGWITISGEDFSHPVTLEISGRYNTRYSVSLKKSIDRPPELAVQFSDHFFLMRYERNAYHMLKFPFFGGIFLSLLGFILLIRFIQRVQIRKRSQLEGQLLSMQMNLISHQLDPHFTFNAIGAISASILTEKPEEANRNLLSLARLMRTFVTETDSPVRTLSAELDFLTHYLELMKGRTDPSFDFKIVVDPGVHSEWLVPRMITQIYAENAIQHGLRPRGGGGRLTVIISASDAGFTIAIEDNGIGRKAAATMKSQGTGKGTRLMEMIYGIFNRNAKNKITCQVTDLTGASGEAAGTRVVITIPTDLKA